MNKLHVLSTQNESRLYYNSQERIYQLCEFPKYHTDIKSTHNLYITSDEKIKQGDYGLSKLNEIINFHNGYDYRYYKKIILTTDQDLIKDGVQKIDDEFLEWFVSKANDSGKPIDIVEVEGHIYKGQDETEYKIIIPQEEPKQETLTYTESAKKEERIFNSTMMFKQETLEEAFEKFMETNFCGQLTKGFVLGAMKFGAKWQQERSYSEEDMKKAFCNGGNLDYSVLTSTEVGTKILNKLFEKFKKK